MDTVRDKILNALTLFYQKIKSIFIQTTNVVNNCASTSTTYPLSAAQGTSLQGQIDDINSTLSDLNNDVNITVHTGSEIFTASHTNASMAARRVGHIVMGKFLFSSGTVDVNSWVTVGTMKKLKPLFDVQYKLTTESTSTSAEGSYVGSLLITSSGTVKMRVTTSGKPYVLNFVYFTEDY